jgi:hypothetical protein
MNITRLNTLNDDKVIIKGGNGGNGGGGNSGGGGGENTLEYIDVRNIDSDLKFGLIKSSSLVKIIDDTIYIWPALFGYLDFGEDLYEYTTAIAIDFSYKVTWGVNEFITIKELISRDQGFPLNVFDSLPRITKEEFYSLEKTPE